MTSLCNQTGNRCPVFRFGFGEIYRRLDNLPVMAAMLISFFEQRSAVWERLDQAFCLFVHSDFFS